MNIIIDKLEVHMPFKLEDGEHYVLETDDYLPSNVRDELIYGLEKRTGCYFELLQGGMKLVR